MMGGIVLISSVNLEENSIRYDDQAGCVLGGLCQVEIDIPSDMKAPIYLYYRINNFF